MPHTISLDDISQQLVSITDFRRKAGGYLDRLAQGQSFIILRDNLPLATVTPVKKLLPINTRQADIEKIKRLSGGFHFKKSLTPKELNDAYDKQYEEMLPR